MVSAPPFYTGDEFAKEFADGFGQFVPLPRSSGEIHDHKTEYTSAVRKILHELAVRRGAVAQDEVRILTGPCRGRFYDQVWSSRGTQILAIESEWLYKVGDQLSDCEKLFYAGCPFRIIIHRAQNDKLIHAIQDRLSDIAPTGKEEYWIFVLGRELNMCVLRRDLGSPRKGRISSHHSFQWRDHGRSRTDRRT